MTTMTRSARTLHATANPSRPTRPDAPDIGDPSDPSDPSDVVGGVDTHRDEHVAAVIDGLGRLLGSARFSADEHGYASLLQWMRTHGNVVMIGVEGTGSYGIGLTRHLALHAGGGVELVEIDRPNRKTRRLQGKSNPIDAEAAARTALSRTRTTTPKDRDGRVEALRNLRVARRSAVEQRADTVRQMKSLIVTAPEQLRHQLRPLAITKLVATCLALRPDHTRITEPHHAAKTSLRHLARRYTHLSQEIDDFDTLIEPLIREINPRLLTITGVGPDCAGQLLVTAGENPHRLHSEAAFAMLCGAAPIPASSGQTRRLRLNRGGDRQANAALYRIALSRLRWDPKTRAYAHRRNTKTDLTKPETIRCLKRYIAREIDHLRSAREGTPPAGSVPRRRRTSGRRS